MNRIVCPIGDVDILVSHRATAIGFDLRRAICSVSLRQPSRAMCWVTAGLLLTSTLSALGQDCVLWGIDPPPTSRIGHAMAFDSLRGKTVLFGGLTDDALGDTWEWDGSRWTLRRLNGPSNRFGHDMAFDSARGVTVLFGGVYRRHTETTYLDDTWEWNGQTWVRVSSEGPSARQGHAMTFDSRRGVTVLFGGIKGSRFGDTWEWNGASWTLRATTGPSARDGHAMAYDSKRGITVLFGGYNGTRLGDTWEWDGNSWVQVSSTGPTNRNNHQMAYDTVHGVVLLLNGNTSNNGSAHDLWAWDGITWSPITNDTPSTPAGHEFAYDAARGRAVCFVRTSSPYSDRGKTWEWDGAHWELRDSREQIELPYTSADAGMSYDRRRGVTVLFGGGYGCTRDGTCNRSNYDYLVDRTWEWDGSVWVKRDVVPPNAPSARAGHAMIFDSTSGESLVFGGYARNEGLVADLWAWNGERWKMLDDGHGGPSARVRCACACDSDRNVLVLFGGYTYDGLSGETWEWNGARWTLRSTVGPEPRYRHAMVYDQKRKVCVLFGGSPNLPYQLGDTWEWDGTTWTQRSTTGPTHRASHAMYYDEARQVTVLFGGAYGNYDDGKAKTDAETWEWDGATWMLRSTGNPLPRFRHAMAYDAYHRSGIVFGGYDGWNSDDYAIDLWERSLDCNCNDELDFYDIRDGLLADCNQDGTADECDGVEPLDCNDNGQRDDCDILEGRSEDCNGDGVPDECERDLSDCDGDGVADFLEVCAGKPDCNGNFVPDDCDLTSGTSKDCNGNGVPDECDIANGSEQDLDANSVPDRCELCAHILDASIRCKRKPRLDVRVNVWTVLPPGVVSILCLDDRLCKTTHVNQEGVMRGIWKNVAPGLHTVCIQDCTDPAWCWQVNCR